MKYNYDMKSTCCSLKMFCPGTLLKNPYLDIDKKLYIVKTNCLLTDGL